MFRSQRILALPLLIALAGCSVGLPYVAPEPTMPLEWKEEDTVQPIPPRNACVWWEVFNDSILNGLEDQALADNLTIEASYQRILQARAVALSAGAPLYPQLTINPTDLNQGLLNKLNVPAGILPGLNNKILYRFHNQQYYFPIDANYEIDLWGKNRLTYEGALADSEAQQDAYYASKLSLTAEVAQNYFQIRGFDSEIDVITRTIASRQEAYRINSERYKAGLVNFTDVSRAEVELRTAQSDLIDAERQRILSVNALAVLLGKAASEFTVDYNPLPPSPPLIPSGIPSEILQRRPDIAQAERALAANHARIGAAKAQFYPSFSLTGAIGYASPDFSKLFEWQARYWAIGGAILGTIFDGGTDQAAFDNAKAAYQVTLADYYNQVLIAIREVEDALADIRYRHSQLETLKELVSASQVTTDLSTDRYLSGLVNYLDVVDAERTLLDSERQAVLVAAQEFIATISLIKALGGGWSN